MRNQTKIILILLLATMMMLSSTACGGKTRFDNNTDDPVLMFAVFDGKTYVEIPLQFAASYSKKSGIHADGIRMFASIGQIVHSQELPEIVYSDGYSIRYDEPFGWETMVELTVYRDTGEEEPERLSQGTDLSALESGRYVLDYCYKITRDDDYDIRSAVFWLIVE